VLEKHLPNHSTQTIWNDAERNDGNTLEMMLNAERAAVEALTRRAAIIMA
jgi:hypothetical protein